MLCALAACGEAVAPAPAGSTAPPEPSDAAASGIVLEVDPEGFFVSSQPVSGEWFAGYDVGCLLPPCGATDGQVIVGRLAGPQPVLITRAAGALDSTRPGVRSVSTSHRAALRAVAAEAFPDGLPGPVGAAFVDALRHVTAEPAPPPPDPLPPVVEPAKPRDAPLAAGAPLMAWAPDGALVVRFRSVEAAFRFSDLADRLAGSLAAAAGEGGDRGTLRLTLHRLLLPSIWHANPNGRKGVAECALVLPPPYTPGPLRAAVVLRIVDPELHDHETRAGVAMESRPEHLWRPAGDPFPERRVRTAVRAVAGDCEVVATDAALLDSVLAGPGRPVGDWTQEAVAAREGLPEPTRSRALTLCAVPGASVSSFAPRAIEWAGGRALAERWLGLRAPAPPADLGGPEPVPAPWADVVALTADTDAAGATVSVRLSSEAAAAALGERLSALPGDAAQLTAACRGNLEALVPLGLVEPRASDVAERAFVWTGRRPVCPLGGTYRFHPATGAPSCTVHGDGTQDAAEPAAPPPSPVTEVVVDGTLLTFRLGIDW